MSTIQPVSIESTDAATRERLESVRASLGVVPNAFAAIANSPAALKGYLAFSGALGEGVLAPHFRTQLALAVAQANSCEYCQAAFSAIGSLSGLSPHEVQAARAAHAESAKTDVGLKFARALVVQDGAVSPSAVALVKAAGFSDEEVVEIVAHVAANTFLNYLNLVAGTSLDFDAAAPLQEERELVGTL